MVCVAAVNPLVGSTLGSSEQVWDKVRTGEARWGGLDVIHILCVILSPSWLPKIHSPLTDSLAQSKARYLNPDPQFPISEMEVRVSEL